MSACQVDESILTTSASNKFNVTKIPAPVQSNYLSGTQVGRYFLRKRPTNQPNVIITFFFTY